MEIPYFNARFYDSAIGRFISADTIIPDPTQSQSYNRYMFVNGNPIMFVDPSGHYAYGDHSSSGSSNPYASSTTDNSSTTAATNTQNTAKAAKANDEKEQKEDNSGDKDKATDTDATKDGPDDKEDDSPKRPDPLPSSPNKYPGKKKSLKEKLGEKVAYVADKTRNSRKWAGAAGMVAGAGMMLGAAAIETGGVIGGLGLFATGVGAGAGVVTIGGATVTAGQLATAGVATFAAGASLYASSKMDGNSDNKFSQEQQDLVEMAKQDKRKGMSEGDMEAYKELNKEIKNPFPDNKVRGPERHAGRKKVNWKHGHVGPVDHIPIK